MNASVSSTLIMMKLALSPATIQPLAHSQPPKQAIPSLMRRGSRNRDGSCEDGRCRISCSRPRHRVAEKTAVDANIPIALGVRGLAASPAGSAEEEGQLGG